MAAIKRFLLIAAVSFLSAASLFAESDKWHISKSSHFIIYYKNTSEDFIDRLIDKAEDYYTNITDDLGFRRYDFWLWDNRAKIYVYDDAESYRAQTGQPKWSSGCVYIKDKTIHTFSSAEQFFNSMLPHEMGHIIFREFVGFDNPAVPIWLDEGVASYQERARFAASDEILRKAIQDGAFINLEALGRFNPHLAGDTRAVNLFYTEAVGVVHYLIKEFGKDNFVFFCQGLRDKRNFSQALDYAYPFRDTLELDKAFMRYLKDE